MSTRGRIISIEGLDGVGKTTLCSAMTECVQLSTPGRHLAEARAQVHAQANCDPVALQLFYAMSVRMAGQRALEHAQDGADVIIDRYWLSTIAYGQARGAPSDLPDVEALIVPADFTIHLVLSEAERRERLIRRGMTPADRETLVPTFRNDVLRNLRACGKRPVAGRLIEIPCTGMTAQQLANEVRVFLGRGPATLATDLAH